MPLVCEVCRRPASEVFLFQASKPFFELPRRYLCAKHGGEAFATPEVLRWSREWEKIRRYSCRVSIEEAREIAARRHGSKGSNSTERFYRDPYYEDTLGVMAELAFEKLTGIPMDRTTRRHGDKGIDFTVLFHGEQVTIDVKGANLPKFLLVKEPDIRRCAKILALAKVWKDVVTFLGWSSKEVMQNCPVRDFGYGIRNYYFPAGDLNDILDLFDNILPLNT